MTAASSSGAGAGIVTRSRGLHLVEPSSEHLLREAFDLEDDLLNQLHRVTQTQKELRKRYARERGLLILPSLETLRKVLGA